MTTTTTTTMMMMIEDDGDVFQGRSPELHASPGDPGLPAEGDAVRALAGRAHRAGRAEVHPHLQALRLPPVLRE